MRIMDMTLGSFLSAYEFGFENKTLTHGRITVNHWGRSNRICPKDWDDQDAKVFCKMMGYNHGYSYVHAATKRSTAVYTP